MSKSSTEWYTHEDCRVIARSLRALLILDTDTGEEFWLPLSQLHEDTTDVEVGYSGPLTMTAWIAKQKGLV
jgi:hypothetical protein